MRQTRRTTLTAAAVVLLALTSCAGEPDGEPGVQTSTPATTTAGDRSSDDGAAGGDPVHVEVQDLATDLVAPWGLAFLPDGRALVTSRDAATVSTVTADGQVTALTGPGAQHLTDVTVRGGEGGLLGVAIAPGLPQDSSSGSGSMVYVYATGARGNMVLRMRLDDDVLSAPEEVLGGIPVSRNHNGGQLAFGPDGMLYVSTGDAGASEAAQDPASLAGKVLRLTPEGGVPDDNPTPGSLVWTLGHRNVQGLGWDGSGRMFATEFGQDTWDEVNLLVPGGNYGWPVVEGMPAATDTSAAGFVAPLAVWDPAQASPSGLAVTDDAVYVAGLRGQTLWRLPLVAASSSAADAAPTTAVLGAPQPLLAEQHGRLRAVALAPDGALWVLTNNTDGRGSPSAGDDRLLRVEVG